MHTGEKLTAPGRTRVAVGDVLRVCFACVVFRATCNGKGGHPGGTLQESGEGEQGAAEPINR